MYYSITYLGSYTGINHCNLGRFSVISPHKVFPYSPRVLWGLLADFVSGMDLPSVLILSIVSCVMLGARVLSRVCFFRASFVLYDTIKIIYIKNFFEGFVASKTTVIHDRWLSDNRLFFRKFECGISIQFLSCRSGNKNNRPKTIVII